MAEIKIENLSTEQKTQVRDGITALKNDITVVQNLLGGSNAASTRTALDALQDDVGVIQSRIGGLNAASTRTAIKAATNTQYSSVYTAKTHINYNIPFLALRNCLQRGISADIVVLGDSTGDGTTRWPRQLAELIKVGYPSVGLEIHDIAPTVSKPWTKTVLGVADAGVTSRYYAPATGNVLEWTSGTTYNAGSFVQKPYLVGGVNRVFKFFCKQTHVADSNNVPTPGTNHSLWVITGSEIITRTSAQNIPVIYGEPNESSNADLEFEIDYTYQPSNYLTFFSDAENLASPSETFRFGMNNDTTSNFSPVLYLRDAAAPGAMSLYAAATANITGVNAGDRIRIRAQFSSTRAKFQNTIWYAKHNGTSWGTWTPCGETKWDPGKSWIKTKNQIYIYPGTPTTAAPTVLHNFIVRKTLSNMVTDTDGVIDFQPTMDLLSGYGTGADSYLGIPNYRIWNFSWTGAEMRQFNQEQHFLINTAPDPDEYIYINYDTDFKYPTNVVLVFINLGHNGHIQPNDTYCAARLRKLISKAKARFPRAQICVMSQNPGINGYLLISPLYSKFNYEPAEGHKQLKKAYEAQVCAEDGHAFIDINRVFVDSGLKDAYSEDGLHPNAAGSILWATTLYKAITGTLDV